MRTDRIFALNRERGGDGSPERVSIGRTTSGLSEFGISQVSRNFTNLCDVEAYIDGLVSELILLRDEARRSFHLPQPAELPQVVSPYA